MLVMKEPNPLPIMPNDLSKHEKMLWMCHNQGLLREHYEYQKYLKHKEYLKSMYKYESRCGKNKRVIN